MEFIKATHIPDSIVTWEQLAAYVGTTMSVAASKTATTYTNSNGVQESVASKATFEVRPPASVNTTSEAYDWLLMRLAIPFPPGWELEGNSQWRNALEVITDAQFQLPSTWYSNA